MNASIDYFSLGVQPGRLTVAIDIFNVFGYEPSKIQSNKDKAWCFLKPKNGSSAAPIQLLQRGYSPFRISGTHLCLRISHADPNIANINLLDQLELILREADAEADILEDQGEYFLRVGSVFQEPIRVRYLQPPQ